MTNSRQSANVRRLRAITASAIPVVGLLLSSSGFAADTTWTNGNATEPDAIKSPTNWTASSPATGKEGLILTSDATLHWGDAATSLGGSGTYGALTIDSPSLTTIDASAVGTTSMGVGSTVFSVAFAGNTGNTIPMISLGSDVTQSVSMVDSFTTIPTILNLQLLQTNATINVTNASASLTIASKIVPKSGATSNIVKTGAGMLALTNVSNTFIGQLQISAGTLAVAGSTPLGATTNTIELDGGFLADTNSASMAFARSLIVDNNNGGITTSGTLSVSGALGGSGMLTKNGVNELFFAASSGTFNGIINVTQGNVRIINPNATAAGTIVRLNATTGNPTLNLRADSDTTYNANVEVTGTQGQIFAANQSTFMAPHVLSVGTVKLANTLNIGGSNGYTVQSGAVTLTGNGTIAANTTSMNITNGVGEATGPFTLTKSGVSNLTINGSTTYTGGTKVLQGNLILKGTDAWNAPLNGAAATDVQGGTLTFDYTSTTTPAAAVRTAITNGQIKDSFAASNVTIGYADDGVSKVNVLPTFFGDATLDGSVTSADFNALAAHFGESDGSVNWSDGDFNYDGVVNTLDFNALASNFGQPIPTMAQPAASLGTVVPEPASLLSVVLIGAMSLRRRRAK